MPPAVRSFVDFLVEKLDNDYREPECPERDEKHKQAAKAAKAGKPAESGILA
jgi:hypothetical protein